METFERIVDFAPGYDKRDPNPSKDYGIHGVTIRFLLKGPKGAVNFTLYTDWFPPSVQEEHRAQGVDLGHRLKPDGVDVGYHSPIPRWDGQTRGDPCEYLDGRPCYYDGSGLRADEWVRDILLTQGSDGIWKALEAEYHSLFDAEPDQLQEA